MSSNAELIGPQGCISLRRITMPSRDLNDLNPATKARAEAFIKACQAEGIEILIYCTYRSPEEQNALYEIGRTKPGKILTNARGGESQHNRRAAFDFVPLVGGKPQWDDKNLYLQCGIIGESCGLEWSGRWSGKLRETAHMQYTKGSSA